MFRPIHGHHPAVSMKTLELEAVNLISVVMYGGLVLLLLLGGCRTLRLQ
jgi:hypothetical protein